MAESKLILGARRCRKDKGTRDLEQIMSFCLDLMIEQIPRFGRSGE